VHGALLIALAVLPPILLCIFFYLQDRLEPEPRGHVLGAFAIGLVAVAPALFVAQTLERIFPPLAATPFGDAYLLAGLVEESTKLTLFLFTAYRWAEFDEPFDGIVYATALALGFAATENVLYVLRGGLAVLALRALFTVPGHGLVGALLGYYAGRAKFARTRGLAVLYIFGGLLVATGVHGTFDLVVSTTTGWQALGLLSALSLALWMVVFRRMSRARSLSPFRLSAKIEP
jgi:RsiW-degrading membrane proteinase PrsW (M82 family)